MTIYNLHEQGDCWGPSCPVCALEDAEPTYLFAEPDADNNPTLWAQTGDQQPRAVLRLTALEASDDRDEMWVRIVDALELAQKQETSR